jgi:hypothetical protein
MTVFAWQLSPARLASSHWSTGFYGQVLYAKVELIKRRFDATAAHARGGSGGSEPRAMPGRSDRSQRSFGLVPGALVPAVPLFSAVRGRIPVPSFATRAHRGADTGRKAVARGLTRQPRHAPKRASSEASQAQFHAFTETWTWADAAEFVNQSATTDANSKRPSDTKASFFIKNSRHGSEMGVFSEQLESPGFKDARKFLLKCLLMF